MSYAPEPAPGLSPLEDLRQLHHHARDLGYVAVPTVVWERLVTALEEMDNHFGYLMEALRPNGSSWNAADARRAQAYSALTAACKANAEREGILL